MRIYEGIADALARQGVQGFFGVLGIETIQIADALVRQHGVGYVAACKEDGAVLMADGYARVSGNVGVATVIGGPGMTNAMTGLVEASRNGTPLVVVVADRTQVQLARSEYALVDSHALAGPIGVGVQVVHAASTVAEDVALCFRRAIYESRPVILNVAAGLLEAECDSSLPPGMKPVSALRCDPDPEAIDRAVELVEQAEFPVILAGRGAVISGAHSALVELGDRIGALLGTSLLAKGYFRGQRFDAGVVGGLGTPACRRLVRESDCIVAFGTSLATLQSMFGYTYGDAHLIQCDVRREAISRYTPVQHAVIGDARSIAEAMIAQLSTRHSQSSGYRSEKVEEELAGHRFEDEFEDESNEHGLDPRAALLRLDEVVPADRTLVFDIGNFMLEGVRMLSVSRPESLVFAARSGAVGCGLGCAIGAAFARPDHPVLLLVGDGGLMMSLTEFDTAVRYQLPLVVAVMNDRAYGMEYLANKVRNMPKGLAQFDRPDYAVLGAAMGGQGASVSDLSDFDELEKRMTTLEGPLLVDIKLNPDVMSRTFVDYVTTMAAMTSE